MSQVRANHIQGDEGAAGGEMRAQESIQTMQSPFFLSVPASGGSFVLEKTINPVT
jgi:hypothetical protein